MSRNIAICRIFGYNKKRIGKCGMNTEVKQKLTFREIVKLISTILSWTVFALLVICAIFLLYYFIATKAYTWSKGKYEPKFSLYTIISGSMIPNINVYDVVIDVRVDDPEDIKIGDVITFYSDNIELRGGTVTHRVVSVIKNSDGTYSYQTKGDNNLVEDSSTVPFDKVIGKVALRIPQLGRVQFFLASSYGWLLLIMIPALYIIFKDINRIIKLKAGAKNKPNEKVDNKPSKLKSILHKPLFKKEKPKLLGYTPTPDAEVKTPTSIFDEPPSAPKSIFDAYDDDVSVDDLPKLK